MLSNHLEPQPSSYISTATWRIRAFHAFQSLRLPRKSRFLSKVPPFLFQLSGIGMFLAVLLPILAPPVPPDSCTFRPCPPRLTEHRFVESPLFISNILECHFSHSSTVRSPRSKMKRIARTARLRVSRTHHRPAATRIREFVESFSPDFLIFWNAVSHSAPGGSTVLG